MTAPVSIALSEVFGPTVQGEGPSMGRQAAFIRTARCNLACRWCDTPYTWDWKGRNGVAYDPKVEVHTIPIADVVEQVWKMAVPLVVITGGEPLVQQTAVTEVARQLRERGLLVEVETNGTLMPDYWLTELVRFNVSPKLTKSEAGTAAQRINYPALARLGEVEGTAFKFVVEDPAELDEVETIVGTACLTDDQVWIMPEGIDADRLTAGMRALADQVVERGWNLTTRLHVLAWGNTRGT